MSDSEDCTESLGLMRKKPATVPCEAFLVTTENLFDGGVIKPLHVITCFHFSSTYSTTSHFLSTSQQLSSTPSHPPAASFPPLPSTVHSLWAVNSGVMGKAPCKTFSR